MSTEDKTNIEERRMCLRRTEKRPAQAGRVTVSTSCGAVDLGHLWLIGGSARCPISKGCMLMDIQKASSETQGCCISEEATKPQSG